MKSSKITNEHLFYVIIFLIALGLRLINLGKIPLSDYEAGFALQALAFSKGLSASFLTQPGYISLTGILFFLLGNTEFLSRIIPVLAGSLIVLVPLFFRNQMGKRASLILAILLMIDPGLTALSRTADGTTMVLTASLLGAGLFLNGQWILSGICAGLALLGGPLVWPGLVYAAGAAWLSDKVFSTDENSLQEENSEPLLRRIFTGKYARFWLALVFVLIIIGTQFLLHPQGLSAVGSGFVEYFRGWISGFTFPPIQSWLLFFFYEPVFLVLGLYCGIRGWFANDPFDKFLLRWWILASLFGLFYPGQEVANFSWALIPMLALAARQIERMVPDKFEIKAPTGAQALVTFALVIFIVMNIVYLSRGQASPEDLRLRIIAVVGSFAILVLTTYLLGTGWSWSTTSVGIKLAAAGLIILSTISASWHAARLGRLPDREMWKNGKTVISGDLLRTTLGNISEYNTGRRDTIDVQVVGIESPALDWGLRDFGKTNHTSQVVTNENSSVILTPGSQIPALGETYRGQNIVWASQPAWPLILPDEWPAWLFFRDAPVDSDSIIVWVRNDLFPGAAANTTPQK
jgi:hypothetical protein